MLNFLFSKSPMPGKLIYVPSEQSFDTTGCSIGGVTSLLIDEVNIELSGDGIAIAIWGPCPDAAWFHAEVTPPSSKRGKLQYTGEVLPDCPIQLNDSGRPCPVTFDPSSGWFHFGYVLPPTYRAVEIMDGVIIGALDGELAGLWLRPTFQR